VIQLLDEDIKYNAMSQSVNPFGDGMAAQRIMQAIFYELGFIDKKPGQFVSAAETTIQKFVSEKHFVAGANAAGYAGIVETVDITRKSEFLSGMFSPENRQRLQRLASAGASGRINPARLEHILFMLAVTRELIETQRRIKQLERQSAETPIAATEKPILENRPIEPAIEAFAEAAAVGLEAQKVAAQEVAARYAESKRGELKQGLTNILIPYVEKGGRETKGAIIRHRAVQKTALVITQNERMVDFVVRMLRRIGFKNIITATSQQQIDEAFAKHQIHLVINKAPEGMFNIPQLPPANLYLPKMPNGKLRKEIERWL